MQGDQKTSLSLKAQTSSALVQVYKRLPIKIVSGQGSFVTDSEGRQFLDMYGGHAVVATGHNHPMLVTALKEQLGRLLFYSNFVHLEHQEEAADALAAELPEPIKKVFFVNSGTEAVENALKISRKVSGRTAILGFEGGFHGRTLGALSCTGIEKYRLGAGMQLEGHHFVPFGDLDAVEVALAKVLPAAIIVEPIQSLAGVRVAPAEFFVGLRKLCDRYQTLLIYDELQTGAGRTGEHYCYAPRHGAIPDLICLGKGVASGVPMAICAMTNALANELSVGDLGTTFGGGPFAAVALKTTLAIIREENLYDNVTTLGQFLKKAVNDLGNDLNQQLSTEIIENVTGSGFLLGIRCRMPAHKLQAALLERQVLAGTSDDPMVLRLMPPLNLSQKEVNMFCDALGGAVTSLAKG